METALIIGALLLVAGLCYWRFYHVPKRERTQFDRMGGGGSGDGGDVEQPH